MKILKLTALLALFAFDSSLLPAAPLYWDAGATTGGSLGGTGNWDTSSALWFNGSADVIWNNANNDDAYFSGTAGTVTLTTGVNAGDLYFTNVTGSYVITNATGVESLTLGNGVVDTGGGTDVFAAVLAGSAPLTKNGNGTLILNGNNSGFGGTVTVNQGALETLTSSGLGTQTITVTNAGSVEFACGGKFTNPYVLSGSGVNGAGALVDLTNAVFTGTTNTGAVTLEGNTTLTGKIGTFDFEGGVAAVTGVNANLTMGGGSAFRLSTASTGNPINLNAGSVTLNGGSLSMGATSLTFSNLTLNGGQFSTGASDAGFGKDPATLNPNNITISNGANILVSHTFTLNGNRGVYVGPGTSDLGENTTSGTLTIGGPISGPGNLLFETDGSGASIKFTGNNTYAGLTTVQTGVGMIVGNAGTTGTFGTGSVLDNGSVTVSRAGTLNYAGGISGTGNLSLTSAAAAIITLSGPLSESGTLSLVGAGAIIFAGSNTYSANTVIGSQYFMANNTNGSGTGTGSVTVGVTGGGSYLGGTGSISGPVTVVTENTLQPGNPLTGSMGILTISNSLTLQAGSMSVLNLNATAPPGSAVVGMTSVTYGGTLTVAVTSGTPVAGQTYQLFQAGSYSGSFEGGIQLPSLPAGLNWNTNNLSVNGTISVTGQNGVFNPPVLSGNQLILSGTSGLANGSYSVEVTTNLAPPITWTVLSSGNTFDASGNFSFTNTVNPAAAQEYFRISQP